MSHKPIYFDPAGSGLEVFLGPSEARLMELVWKRGPVTVKKALYYLDVSPKPAYTTVMTVLAKLAEKGLLSRKKEGRNYVYSAAVDKESFVEERVSLINDCLNRNFPAKRGTGKTRKRKRT